MALPPGRKRRFLAYGVLNVLLTNLVLQALLPVFSTGWATFCSQLLNTVLGFVLYGKRVFRVQRLEWQAAGRYVVLAALIWCSNWAGIVLLAQLGMRRSWAALLLVPLLAGLSYAAQKLVVFRQHQPQAVLK